MFVLIFFSISSGKAATSSQFRFFLFFFFLSSGLTMNFRDFRATFRPEICRKLRVQLSGLPQTKYVSPSSVILKIRTCSSDLGETRGIPETFRQKHGKCYERKPAVKIEVLWCCPFSRASCELKLTVLRVSRQNRVDLKWQTINLLGFVFSTK